MFTVRYVDPAARRGDATQVIRFNYPMDAEVWALNAGNRGIEVLSVAWEAIDHPDYEPCI